MKHSDFYIGLEFYTDAGKWRCTDVGSRVVVAISLEPRDVAQVQRGRETEAAISKRSVSEQDLNGPPYSVAEIVLDEYDLDGCSLSR